MPNDAGQTETVQTETVQTETGQTSREERLAAKLRENLKRRKAQARLIGGDAPGANPAGAESNASLSKAPPKS